MRRLPLTRDERTREQSFDEATSSSRSEGVEDITGNMEINPGLEETLGEESKLDGGKAIPGGEDDIPAQKGAHKVREKQDEQYLLSLVW